MSPKGVEGCVLQTGFSGYGNEHYAQDVYIKRSIVTGFGSYVNKQNLLSLIPTTIIKKWHIISTTGSIFFDEHGYVLWISYLICVILVTAVFYIIVLYQIVL